MNINKTYKTWKSKVIAGWPFASEQPKDIGQTGVTFDQRGVALAHQQCITKAAPPYIDVCVFLPYDDPSQQELALINLVKKHSLKSSPCVFILQPEDYRLLLLESPDVEERDLKDAVRWKVKDMIDFPVTEAVLDTFSLPLSNAQKNKMIYVAVTKHSTIQRIANIIQTAGLNLVAVDIAEMAIQNICQLLPENIDGMAFVRLQSNKSQIILSHQHNIYVSRSIELDLGSLANINGQEQPDQIKHKEHLENLTLEIQRSLDYYASQFTNEPASNFIVSPLASLYDEALLEYLAQKLDANVKILNMNEIIRTVNPLTASLQSTCLLALGGMLRESVY